MPRPGRRRSSIPTLGGNHARASDIDDHGWIVGWSSLPGDQGIHAAVWIDGQPIELGTLGGAHAEAYAINAARQVVGYSQRADGVGRACLWTLNPDGSVATRTDLGGVNDSASHALGVNDEGAVVGSSNARAFVWTNGGMQDLNTLIPSDSGWTLERAWAINGRGQIVGSGLVMGFPRAFLLTEGCAGDFNGDGLLNVFDFLAFQTAFGSGSLEADLAPPFGVLNIFDFLAFQTAFGQGC